MSTFWKVALIVLLNIIVSAGVTLGVLWYWENVRNSEQPYQLVTIEQTAEPEIAPTEEIAVIPTGEIAEETLPTTVLTESTDTEPTPVIRGAKVEIAIIRTPGILATEALRIVNNSDEVITLENWTLEDAEGHILHFPNIQLLRKGVFVEVYSRTGHTTPYEIYWDQDEAVWQSGETAVIKDVFGQIQATYRVP